MSNLQRILFILGFLSFLFVPIKHSIHMFQQNRYQFLRYKTWLCQMLPYQYRKLFIAFVLFMPFYGLVLMRRVSLKITLMILLLFIYSILVLRVEQQKKARIPLAVTNRVKRFFLATFLFTIILAFFLTHQSINTLAILLPVLFFTPWLTLFIVGGVLQPIEEKIRRYYRKDALRILRSNTQLKIVGITGSYGKTSLKTILNTLLNENYYTLMTPHSYNNTMGITRTIRELLQPIHEIFLCEMGADHIHEIERLMKFVQPYYGIITAIGPQHLSTFHTMETILHEKMQMIERLPINGIGVLNMDNDFIRKYKIQNTCRILWYGTREECDYRILNVNYTKNGSTFQIQHKNKQHSFSTKLLGMHNILNICGAITLAHTLQVSWDTLQRLVANLEYVEHRLQIKKASLYTILDNAYNSNPEGAKYALDVIKQMEGKRIIVTPGFLDLGNLEKSAHQVFGQQIADSVDEVILVGKNQTKEILVGLTKTHFALDKIYVVNGIEEAFALLQRIADSNTIVLLENDLPDAFNH